MSPGASGSSSSPEAGTLGGMAVDFSEVPLEAALPARFEVRRDLGEGGFGKVLLARDAELGRDVAVKVVGLRVREDAEMLARFDREARAMARLSHPHLVRILDHSIAPPTPFLVMERVRGRDLADLMTRHGKFPPAEVARILAQAAAAVDALHAEGMVHRDLKPPNLMLRGGDGDVVVMDLGLVHLPDMTALTRTGQVMGTPRYLAPEVLRGEGAGPASDQFQLAVVARELLTGRALVDGDDVVEISRNVLEGKFRPLPEEVPAAAARVLDRVLLGDPEERFPSCEDFAVALGAALRGEELPDAASPPPGDASAGPGPGESRPRGRVRPPLAVLAATGLAAALGAGWALWPGTPGAARWAVVGDALVVELDPGSAAGLALEVAGRRVPGAPRAAGGGRVRLVAPGVLGDEEVPARLLWGGGAGPRVGFRAEELALDPEVRLGARGGFEARVRRACAVGWSGAAPVPAAPGVLALGDPGGEVLRLRWEERGVEFTREVHRADVHARWVRDLERALAEVDLEGNLVKRLAARGLGALGPGPATWSAAAARVPEVLAGPAPIGSRRRLLRLLSRWRLAFAAAEIALLAPPNLDLPPGAAGARLLGLPRWSRAGGARPALRPSENYRVEDPRKAGYQLASREGTLTLNMRYRDAARFLEFEWPAVDAAGGLVAVSLASHTMAPEGVLEVRPAGDAPGGAAPLHFWLPRAREGKSTGAADWMTVVIPGDLAPPPGARMRITVAGIGHPDALFAWVEAVRVEASPAGRGRVGGTLPGRS